MGKKVIIEGVETKDQAELLIAQGADVIQGFYYARPMDDQSYIRFLNQQ